MQQDAFEALVARLEVESREHPRRYLFRVAAVALMGFGIFAVAVGHAVILIGALAGIIFLLSKSGGGAGIAIILAKVGKGVRLLLELDVEATLPACSMIYGFLQPTDPARAEPYRERFLQRQELEERRQNELRSFEGSQVQLVACDLSAPELAAFADAVRQNRTGVTRAWLLRRVIQADENARAYILAVETKRLVWGRARQKVVDRLAQLEFPGVIHIVPLSSRNFRRMRKQIHAMHVAPLFVSVDQPTEH